MVRKFVGALALTALVASGAQAQFNTTFQFVSGTAYNNLFGAFTDPSIAVNPGKTGEIAGLPFQIWCVDPMQTSEPGSTIYNADVTPFASTFTTNGVTEDGRVQASVLDDYTHPVASSNQLADYENAAALAVAMQLYGGVGSNPSVLDFERAIWYQMGYVRADANPADVVGISAAYNAANISTWSSFASIDATNWGVISDVNAGMQEFIFFNPNGIPLSNTPEPATMSLMAMGLVGMAGSTLRRRKQRKA